MARDSSLMTYRLDPENPWPGLAWFDESAASFFNGRRREIVELKRLVTEAPLTVLFGRSGLGKTSLIKAGLFPALRPSGFLPVYVRLAFRDDDRENHGPLVEQLARAFADACASAPAEAPARVEGESLWEYLHRAAFKVWSAHNQPLVPLFVIDQFEEVFTLGAAAPLAVSRLREDLADLIENRIPVQTEGKLAADGQAGAGFALRSQPYRVLLSFREDFATAFERWHELPSLMRNRLQLSSLNGLQAFDVVFESGSRFLTRETAEAIVRFVAQARRAPTAGSDAESGPLSSLVVEPALLSLVCRGLNDRRHARAAEGGANTIDADLLASTGPAVVDNHYDDCMRDQPERVHRFVEAELVTESGFRKPCAQDDALREPYGVSLDALRVLVDRRLLRIEPSLGVTRVELIHDLLAPTVVARRDARRKADQERRANEEWQRADEQRRAAAQERERDQRSRRRFRVAVIVALLASGVTVGVGSLAFYARAQQRLAQAQQRLAQAESERAKNQALIARSRELASAAMTRLDLDPELAVRLAVDAAAVSPTVQAESALRQALRKWGDIRDPRATRVELVPRPTPGTRGAPREPPLLPSPIRQFVGHHGSVTSVALSNDGKTLLSTGCDTTARVWDTRTGALLNVLKGHRHSLMVGAFSPDGRLIATGGGNFCPGDASNSSAEWGRGDTVIRVWDASSGKQLSRLEGSQEMVMGLAFSPDGQSLAAGGSDAELRVWDLSSRQVRTIGTHDGGIQWIAYSPDGRQLASAGSDGKVIIWDPTRPGTKVAELLHKGGVVLGVSYSGDGRSIGSTEFGGIAKIWDTRTFELEREIKSYGGTSNATAFSRDGRFLVTAGSEFSIWDTATGARLKSLGIQGGLYGTAISSDSTLIALGGESGLVGTYSCEVCVPLDGLRKLVERHPPRPLTEQERKDFGSPTDLSAR